MHALGRKILLRCTPGCGLCKEKLTRSMDAKYGEYCSLSPVKKAISRVIKDLLSVYRSQLIQEDDIEGQQRLLAEETDFYVNPDIPPASEEETTKLCRDTYAFLTQLRKETVLFDFDDMIDQVVYHKFRPSRRYDVILGDEVQDWTPAQAEFVRIAADGKARVILVGDRHQAIYGWRGADTQSMTHLKETFNCLELPLSVCYRCPISVVLVAQEIVGTHVIEWRDDAPPGHVERRPVTKLEETLRELQPGDMALARTNAMLVGPAMRLLMRGTKVLIRGSSIGKSLITLAEKLSVGRQDIVGFTNRVAAYKGEKVQHFLDRGDEKAAQAIEDKCDCLLLFTDHETSVAAIIDRLRTLFSDLTPENAILFSTVHRAKGMEANRVVVLGPELMPHPMALKYGTEEDIAQEHNIRYVAFTRAMDTLILQAMK